MDPTADLAREAALRLLDPDRVTPTGGAEHIAWWWSAGSVGCLTRATRRQSSRWRWWSTTGRDQLADKDQAADGWREWLRISNALNLREQPTIDHGASPTGRSSQDVSHGGSHGPFGMMV